MSNCEIETYTTFWGPPKQLQFSLEYPGKVNWHLVNWYLVSWSLPALKKKVTNDSCYLFVFLMQLSTPPINEHKFILHERYFYIIAQGRNK